MKNVYTHTNDRDTPRAVKRTASCSSKNALATHKKRQMGQNHGDSKNILQIHDINHIFILSLQNKVVSLQC
jgi:hypothetical protein